MSLYEYLAVLFELFFFDKISEDKFVSKVTSDSRKDTRVFSVLQKSFLDY